MKLIAFINSDESSYGQISALINRMETEEIIIVKDKSTSNPFLNPSIKIAEVNSSSDLITFKKEIEEKVRPHLKSDFEVALSLASGNGKEHMAMISALLNLPVGIKLVAYTKKGVEFLS